MEYHPQRSTTNHSDLFELLDRLQSSRLNDQRCELPSVLTGASNKVLQQQTNSSSSLSSSSWNNSSTSSSSHGAQKTSSSPDGQFATRQMLQRILKHPPPYPMVALTLPGTYWIEPSEDPNRRHHQVRINCMPDNEEESAKMYRVHFSGFEHYNFCGISDGAEAGGQQQQPLVLSLKIYSNDENNNDLDGDEDDRNVRVILRSLDKTVHQVMRLPDLTSNNNDRPVAIIETVMSHMGMAPAMPVMFPGISDIIAAFDEHCISNTFKFGLIYQKFGQVTEEAIFSNRTHSPAMEEFMQLLGQTVELQEHHGYRGGLDTRHGQTGSHALYEKYQGNEIMFHVSTLLPYVESDPQQLQRKCHIGNDIVAIVFQEVNTPFAPDMIASHFLHAYILVQPIDPCTSITRYRVSVAAQKDVPQFGPQLPSSAIFDKGLAFKDFLLAKLINGERSCYQANKFQALHQRTRATLLANLAKELREQSVDYINSYSSLFSPMLTNAVKDSKSPSPSSSRLFTSVKRALKHVGSTSGGKSEFQRHASSGSLTDVMEPPSRNNKGQQQSLLSSSAVVTEDSYKADSGHGDSDGSLPSSPQLHHVRSKKLSTSQPHLSVLNDVVAGHHHDTSVEADDIIYEKRSSRIGHLHHHPLLHQQQRVRPRPPLQLPHNAKGGQIIDPDCHTVISGAVTTIPVGGSPTSTASSSASSLSSTSATTPSSPPPPSSSSSSSSSSTCVARLHQDISRLRVDKLELLRQTLSAQHEVRQLRQRESQLETDLALAAAEIRRLLQNQVIVPKVVGGGVGKLIQPPDVTMLTTATSPSTSSAASNCSSSRSSTGGETSSSSSTRRSLPRHQHHPI